MIVDLQNVDSQAVIPAMGGPERDVLSSDWMPPLYHATRKGRVFYLENQALTMATTHNTPMDAATDTFIVGFLNPLNSKVNAVILSGWMANVSGTPGPQAHPVWNAAFGTQSLTAVASGSIRSGYLGAGTPSAMRAYNNVALTGLTTGAHNFSAPRPFGVDTFAAAIAANGNNGSYDNVQGALIVPPGVMVGLCAGTTAGTTWVVSAGICWMEVPI